MKVNTDKIRFLYGRPFLTLPSWPGRLRLDLRNLCRVITVHIYSLW
jgi:hypothetical protein